MISKVFALYFSGTGNTKYVVKRFCENLEQRDIACTMISIEEFKIIEERIQNADIIILAYPIYGSNMPWIMRKFLQENKLLFNHKKIITIITQLFFSGDGAALATRYLKKLNIQVHHLSSIHINMPSNISDLTIFKIKNDLEIHSKLTKSSKKIDLCAKKTMNNQMIKDGRRIYSWFLGFFGQRVWSNLFLEKKLKRALKVDHTLCSKCGKCIICCPTNNLYFHEKNVKTKNICTQCYRCINLCPNKAISLFSKKKPKKQYKGIFD